MLVKYQQKSSRVKGIAFHPRRPWILASLHNGVIQLIDYSMEVVIDTFEEHEGPVRGIDFHGTQPLFVSGGDDYKVKVWNYKLRRCLFSLNGHLDYIRTVQFHHEYPWILTASDDQTIRIWNWQSRTCITVLTGHNHYVMCARFHPRDDLVVSASLDQTVRVWDISGLRKKNVTIQTNDPLSMRGGQPAADLFGGTDVVVKYVLEGHTRGVNWAEFHPKLPLIVSGADDREVKLWRMSESKAWEVDTMRGHINNVSSVAFHPKHEWIVSNSEDKSIRVWDISRQTAPQSFRRESDRYWILATHPSKNLLAAGHDSGLLVFKLDRERPPFDVHKSDLFFLHDRYIRKVGAKSGSEMPLLAYQGKPRTLWYNFMNPSQHNLLLVSDTDRGSYELICFSGDRGDNAETMRGLGISACFSSRNRFAVLDQSKQLYLKSLKNETKKRIDLPTTSVEALFPAGIGRILLKCPDKMILFDLQTKQTVQSLATPPRTPVKYVHWSRDRKYVVFLSKSTVQLASSALKEICSFSETTRVKSGAWDPENGIFFYTTSTHLKYCLTSGDSGTIKTLDQVLYLTNVRNGKSIGYINRSGEVGSIEIDATEALFKKALVTRDLPKVLEIVKSNALVGQAIVGFLRKKGYPEVALRFVQDPKTRFTLALECGDLPTALEGAHAIEDQSCWNRLASEALLQGEIPVLELALQKTRDFEQLSFLYLITGNTQKLSKMLQIAKARHEPMARFHTSLMLGNVEERLSVLKEQGQGALASILAQVHDIPDDGEEGVSPTKEGRLLVPPVPLQSEMEWPKMPLPKGYFDESFEVEQVEIEEAVDVDVQGWDEEDEDEPLERVHSEVFEDAGGWGDDFGLDLPEEDGIHEKEDDVFMMPTHGTCIGKKWQEKAKEPSDLIAAGQLDLAMQSLHRRSGIVNFKALKHLFMELSMPFVEIAALPGAGPLEVSMCRDDGMPRTSLSVQVCEEMLKQALRSFVEAKDLPGTLELFREVLRRLVFVDENIRHELLETSREYCVAMRLELERRSEEDPLRQMSLAALLTECHLQPVHMFLGLRVAIKSAYSVQNYRTAGLFCRKFLELSQVHKLPRSMASSVPQVKKYLKACDQKDSDENPLEYDLFAGVSVCGTSLTAVAFDTASARCSYCQVIHLEEYVGSVCPNCEIAMVSKSI